MLLKISFIGILILTFFGGSCKKNSQKTSSKQDVYVAGNTNYNGIQVATYWKNGTPTVLSHSASTGIGIALVGKDVYVSGYRTIINNRTVAAYWKNGVEADLADSNITSLAQNITVVDSNVYIVGTTTVAEISNATIWKNGVATLLPRGAGFSEAGGISNSNNNIYVVGINNIDLNSSYYLGVYWKNSIETVLPNGIYNVTTAVGIAANGTNTYITGNAVLDTQIQGNMVPVQYPVYWKNSVLATLSVMPGYTLASTSAIGLRGSDVFIAGVSKNSNGIYSASIWENGNPSILEDNSSGSPSANSLSYALTINGNDIYVIGQDKAGLPAYWKNGNLVELTAPAGNTNSANSLVLVNN